MEECCRSCQEVGFTAQEEPEKTVTLKRATARAFRILAPTM
jgi:hypothetical protein